MAIFLTAAQAYRVIQRELPEGTYPDGAPDTYFSTADSAATASGVADAYANMQVIYANMFPATANEEQTLWEVMVFGYQLDPTIDLPTRQLSVIAKLQSLLSMSVPDTVTYIYSIIGADKIVEIVEWAQPGGTWILDVSPVGISTYLGEGPVNAAFGPSLCAQSPSDFGLTQDQWTGIQTNAYTYEVRIYGYTLTDAQRTALDIGLDSFEPAHSHHIITDGLDPTQTLRRDDALPDLAQTFLHFHADDYLGGSWTARTGSYVAAATPAAAPRSGVPHLGYENGVGTFADGAFDVIAGFEVPLAISISPGAAEQWTIEAKFTYASNPGSDGATIFQMANALLNGVAGFTIAPDGSFQFVVYGNGSSVWIFDSGLPGLFVPGGTYLATMTFNMTTRAFSLYVNGALVHSNTYGAAATYTQLAAVLALGFSDLSLSGFGIAAPLDGQLIELVFSKTLLAAADVAARALNFNTILELHNG